MIIKQTKESKKQKKDSLEQEIIVLSEERKIAKGKRNRNFTLASSLHRKTKELQAELLLLY
jgi:hypothetical protein